jgi:thiol-disulfide isomerase/thioredoxin
MHRISVLLIATIVTGLVASAGAAVKVGDSPNLQLKLIDGSVLTSKDMEGQMVVLEFWATWCGPCKAQIPHLKQLNAEYAPKGVRLISVSRDDNRQPVMPFIQQNGMNWTHVIDAEQPQQLGPAFGVTGIPHAFIISPKGEVLWRGHPASIEQPLAQAVQQNPPLPPASVRRAEMSKQVDEAIDAIDKEMNFMPALELFSGMEPDQLRDPKLMTTLRPLMMRFRPTGERGAALAKFLQDHPEAIEKLAAMGVRLPSAGEAVEPEAKNQAIAERLMKIADGLRDSDKHVEAYGKYKLIASRYGKTESGAAAAERVAAYEADEQFMKKMQAADQADRAKADFNMAWGYQQAGRDDLAKQGYQKIVDQFPDTEWAAKAKVALENM